MNEETDELMRQAQTFGQAGQIAQQNAANQYYMEEGEKSLAEAQLEVNAILTEIYHELRQDTLQEKEGKMIWVDVKDEKQRALTNWGVNKIMQIMKFYINKNTLLSNFDEKTINRIMDRFLLELNDLVLLKYQELFRQPTFEECKSIMMDRLENKKKLRMFALEIVGKSTDEEQIKKDLINEIEARIEKEISKVREEQRKEKLREYGSFMAELEIVVLSTLNRAWKGEERGSLRRHTNIHEMLGQQKILPAEKGGMFKWTRG